MDFPAVDEVLEPSASAADRTFAELEFTPGLNYYLLRLDRMQFAGDSVLDAGCGMGQWSVALSQRFRQVQALDLRDDRLKVLRKLITRLGLNIAVRKGSIEQLPFADESFDAVFCYGVIMFTRVNSSLAEFHRVLRPGGRVYICLNGDGWSKYLVRERGQRSPQVAQMGGWSLYKTAWHRAVRAGLLEEWRVLQQRRSSLLRIGLDFGGRVGVVRRVLCKRLLQMRPAGRALRRAITRGCGRNWLPRLYRDVWLSWHGKDVTTDFDAERVYLPEEFGELADQTGFVDYQWAVESGLVCNWLLPVPTPRYEGHYDCAPAVWECLLTKPSATADVVPEGHHHAAQAAQASPAYIEAAEGAVLSNGSRWTFPRGAYEQAVAMAQGRGPRYLERLTRAVVNGARSEEEAAQRIVEFVQRSLYRDPVSQPLTETRELPPPIVTLFAARGRCRHAASLVVELCRLAGLKAGLHQLPQHTSAFIEIDRRRLVADADAYKNGIIPRNSQGQWVSYEDLERHPYHLDCYPATGWYILPGTRYTTGAGGGQLYGYVDALMPEDRGYVSGYYSAEAAGAPPSLPGEVQLFVRGSNFVVQWSPSRVVGDQLVDYRLCVGTRSRGWSYQELGHRDEVAQELPRDVLFVETTQRAVEGLLPLAVSQLYASVTAVSSRIEKEPRTHFMPSEEACWTLRDSEGALQAERGIP